MMTRSLEEKPHILARNENEFINFQTKEILGIPPTLQDVLRAINQSRSEICYGITDSGNFSGERDTFLAVRYDLTKPLSEQSEETLDFLLEVISA